jgi:hypothetical protein
MHVADADGVVVMDPCVSNQEFRIRGSCSDGAAGAIAGATGTAKVNPLYGDVGAKRARQVLCAAADQLDYGGQLLGRSDIFQLSRFGIERVAVLEAGDLGDLIPACVDTERVAVLASSSLVLASISSPGRMSVPVQFQAASARSSVVAKNANIATNGTSRIRRFPNTAPQYSAGFLNLPYNLQNGHCRVTSHACYGHSNICAEE